MRKTKIYGVWSGIKKRCLDVNDPMFHYYGGRGIGVCERWLKFENFFADMGHPPDGKQIDRIDNNGSYEPSNCRWVSRTENCNNRRSTVFIEFDGKRQSISDWERELGFNKYTLQARLKLGWPIEQALTVPASSSNTSRFKEKITHCKRGHLYTTETTRIHRGGKRSCKVCSKDLRK